MAKFSTDVLSYYQGLEFDGMDDYVEIGDIGYAQFPLTLEIKILINNYSDANTILGFCEPDTIGNMLTLQIYDDRFRISSYRSAFDGNNLSNSTVSTGEWLHLAVVIPQDDQYQFFINGVLDKNDIGTLRFPTNATELYLGTFFRSGSRQGMLSGLLGETRIWNIERTQQEIQLNMNRSFNGSETGLIAYYPMNEGVGDVIYDHSPNQNDGIIHGATWTNKVGFKV